MGALYNGIAEAVFAVDLDSRCVTYWNKGAETMFGYPADEALQRTTEFLHPDRAAFDRIYDLVVPEIGRQGFWRGEWSYRRRDTSVFPAEVTATMIRSEDLPTANVVVVVRDITKRRESENQIHRLNRQLARRVVERTSQLISTRNELTKEEDQRKAIEERFQWFVEGVKDYAILMLDMDGHIMNWPATAERMLGYTRSAAVGKHFSELFERGKAEAAGILEKSQGSESFDERVWLAQQNGSRVYADIVIGPLHDTMGDRRGFSMIVRDVTERVAMQQKLREKEYLATVGTTATMFAHEISNPLNGISTTIQLLDRLLTAENFPKQELASSALSDVKSEIRRLQSLLSEFRMLARPTPLNLQAVDLIELVHDSVKLLAVDSAERDISVREDFPARLAAVNGDPDKLKQAILNLAKNAVEAMPNGGTITITGSDHGRDIRLEIVDTGPGIPEGVKIFEPFSSSKPGGSGLGLAIVQQIVSAHDGTISYSTAPGKGTSFQLTLPKAPAPKVS